MKAKGHDPKLDDEGEIDMFAVSYEYHNGPACAACGWSCCEHCEKISDIPECDDPPIEGTIVKGFICR